LGLCVVAIAHAQTPTAGDGIRKYCLTCHNARLKTAGLTLDADAAAHAGDNAELWEKVVRKLRTGTMPPAGMPRPDAATYDLMASSLETELDRAAAAKPVAGKVPLLHRLSRTEYQNAVRDVLALDAMPKEMDFSVLLPEDNAASGFDNLADLLFISPAAMEQYLGAAEKISRLAVGDPSTPVMVNRYRLPDELPQDERVDGLPFGTRGGMAARSDFPADGEYGFKLELAATPRQPEQIEILLDGERLEMVTVGGGGRGGRGARDANKPLEFRLPVKAGPHLVGVTFIERDTVRDEETLRPRMRSRGTQPALASVTISGPYDARKPVDTPSRRRIFV